MIDLVRYASDGYLVVENVVPHPVLDRFIAVIERRVDEMAGTAQAAGEIRQAYDHLPFEERLLAVAEGRPAVPRAFDPLLFCRDACDLLRHPTLTDLLAAILGPDVTYQGNGHLRAHRPGPLDPLPWHQDAQFYGSGTECMADYMVQTWLPLVDTGTERGCLAVVPGSHRWGLLPEAVNGADNVERSTPDRQDRIYRGNAARIAANRITLLPMRKGDVVLFSSLLVHTGTENRSDVIRWSMDVRFEATLGARPLTDRARHGYEVMRRRLDGRGYVPLAVRDGEGGSEDWAAWQSRRDRIADAEKGL